MVEAERIEILQFFLGLSMVWFVWSFIYKRTRLDAFRENLFTIRDELFDYMWHRGISYDLEAYGLLRSSMNGMIQSAGSVNIWTLILFGWTVGRQEHEGFRVHDAIAAIEDRETRVYFESVSDKIGKLGARHIIIEGPLCFAGTIALGVMVLVAEHARFNRREQVVELGAELGRRELECFQEDDLQPARAT